jgi:hypothetical protein
MSMELKSLVSLIVRTTKITKIKSKTMKIKNAKFPATAWKKVISFGFVHVLLRGHH